MKNYIANIAATIEQLQRLADIARTLPPEVGEHWDACVNHFESASLVQFHWHERDDTTTDRQKTAKQIARAFGGEWTRDADGSWRARLPNDRDHMGIGIIIHGVEPALKSGPRIELDEPDAPEDEDARAGLAGNIGEHEDHFDDHGAPINHAVTNR